jgi:rubrerythrin
MASVKGSRTDQNLRHAFSDEGRFNRLNLSCTQAAAAEGQRESATLAQAADDRGAGYAGGHLDFRVAGYDTSAPLGSSAVELATAIATMKDDHTAMYAGMARTAHDEGFEEIAGWFEILAKPGRSHVREMRWVLENMR